MVHQKGKVSSSDSPLLRVEKPMRVQVRIDPSHPHLCRKRLLNGAVLRMKPEKPRPRVTPGGGGGGGGGVLVIILVKGTDVPLRFSKHPPFIYSIFLKTIPNHIFLLKILTQSYIS
jgi:hypothetical protein